MADQTGYDDVVAEVFEFLADGLAAAAEAGLDLARVAVDPGIGFAKDADGSLALLRALRQFCSLGRPVLVGGSRKSFLGDPLGGGGPGDRLAGSLAVAAAAAVANAAIVRVHDVAETVQAVRTARAIASGDRDWPSAIA
jgi:dihydropteroate synthase